MANASAATLMTAEDLLRLPDDGNQYELVRGKRICMGGTPARPAIVAANIGTLINVFVRQHRLGVCGGADFGFLLASNPDTVRVPDFAFVRAERVPAAGIPDGFWQGAPDLAIEVFSPSNRFTDVLEKVYEYLAAGARLVWVVEPEARKAMVFRPGAAPPLVLGEDGVLDGEDVLPGFTLPLREVWV